jgi:hypothetical protein
MTQVLKGRGKPANYACVSHVLLSQSDVSHAHLCGSLRFGLGKALLTGFAKAHFPVELEFVLKIALQPLSSQHIEKSVKDPHFKPA